MQVHMPVIDGLLVKSTTMYFYIDLVIHFSSGQLFYLTVGQAPRDDEYSNYRKWQQPITG